MSRCASWRASPRRRDCCTSTNSRRAPRETLWLCDAYFPGIPSYIQGLRAAALDVWLLVPGGTDIPILRPLWRTDYQPLLEAGVRVFEWNGPMIHAKTAIADGRWARVGSSNLNGTSWMEKYERDAVIEDAAFARLMMEQYERDLTNATEVLLHEHRCPRRPRPAAALCLWLGAALVARAWRLRRDRAVREDRTADPGSLPPKAQP